MEKSILKELLKHGKLLMIPIVGLAIFPVWLFKWNPLVDNLDLRLIYLLPLIIFSILMVVSLQEYILKVDLWLFKNSNSEVLYFSGLIGYISLIFGFILIVRGIGNKSLTYRVLIEQEFYQIISLFYLSYIAFSVQKTHMPTEVGN